MINPLVVIVAVAAIAAGAGAAGALNMWYDEDIDGLMSRTSKRPIPSGRVLPAEALGFASAVGRPVTGASKPRSPRPLIR